LIIIIALSKKEARAERKNMAWREMRRGAQ